MPAVKIVQKPVLPIRTGAIKIKLQKPKDNGSTSWYLRAHHECGCKFRTDNTLVWCSKVGCETVMTKAEFLTKYTLEV
jgi:hypothetical protein